jgi:hypothetical protein
MAQFSGCLRLSLVVLFLIVAGKQQGRISLHKTSETHAVDLVEVFLHEAVKSSPVDLVEVLFNKAVET